MSEVKQEQGNLSINSENLFPIIKKWLYSDHDIFFRELISNGCDAVTKVQKLEVMGEYQLQEGEKFRVDVIVNPEEKTLKFIDNGIGMTADEVKEYITQIAFSGATDFLEKYKDKTNEDQIIGHFGLGFYSAFMVADKVTIDTLSYQEGAEPVYWECDGDSEYSMSKGSRTTRGTEITLYLKTAMNSPMNIVPVKLSRSIVLSCLLRSTSAKKAANRNIRPSRRMNFVRMMSSQRQLSKMRRQKRRRMRTARKKPLLYLLVRKDTRSISVLP